MKNTRFLNIAILFVAALVSFESAQSQTSRPAPPSGSIQGAVIQWGGSEPIAKATVELRGVSQASAEALKTTSDGDGKFYFVGLQAGNYRILVRRDGNVAAEYGQQWLNGPGQPLTLTAGQQVTGADVPMLAAATISGRITDSNGGPAVNVQVSALKVSYQGLQRMLRTVQETRTNQDGEYRLFWMTPGRYYIAAVATGWAANGQIIVNSDGAAANGAVSNSTTQARTVLGQNAIANPGGPGSPAQLPPVFFPSEPSVDFAMPIDAPSGSEYRGADVRLIPVPTFHVCGVVTVVGDIKPPADPVPAPGRGAAGTPSGTPPRGAQPGTPPTVAPPRGAIQLSEITPDLSAFNITFANGVARGAAQPAPICPGLGGAPLPPQARGSVRLVAVGPRATVSNTSGGTYQGAIDANTGRFQLRNVTPGMYELSSSTPGNTQTPGFNGRVAVEVRGDVESATLTLEQGFDLKVRIATEMPPSGKPPQIGRLLRPYLGDDPPSPRDPFLGDFTPDETMIRNLPREAYRVYLQPLINSVVAPAVQRDSALQDVYVKSITYGGADALNLPLRFNADPDATLEIRIGANPGTLEGRVLRSDGNPAVGALVTLLPNAPGVRIFRTDMYRAVNTGRDGKFQAKGIPPGDYKVFAWAGIERDGWLDPDLQRANEEHGRSIHIDEGKNGSIELPLILPYAP